MLTLLDTTLRDGSYVVDFRFTAMDTALIAGALDACGVPLIEVGHGIGMRAGTLAPSRSACTDLEYANAAASAVTRGKWGMFCIPGIAQLDDVDLLADAGAHFIRIGTNVTSVAEAAPFIARARARGLWVSANFMKTYALSPRAVAVEAMRAADFGADLVCIVDSAGGMLPDDVGAYSDATREAIRVPFGFHGHDNLGLAVANTLRAVQAGATVIDTSLRGMGRSAGNACTEMVLFALQRQGIDLGIDPISMLTIAEQRIDPMLRAHQSRDSIGIVSGFAQFHSSFLDRVYDAARAHDVDPRALIVSVSEEDKINAPVELVNRHAEQLATVRVATSWLMPDLPIVRPDLVGSLTALVQHVAQEAHSLARRRGKHSVFTIVQAWREASRSTVFRSLHEGATAVMASAEAATPAIAAQIAAAAQDYVDTILLDADSKTAQSAPIIDAVRAAVDARVVLLTYSDIEAWSRSIAHLVHSTITTQHGTVSQHGSIRLYSGDARTEVLGTRVAAALELRGVVVSQTATTPEAILVCCAPLPPSECAAWMQGVSHVIDGWIGALPSDVLEQAHSSGLSVQRVEMRAVMQAELLVAQAMHGAEAGRGTGTMDGVAVAAGGVIAPRGTVILDSLQAPSQVFGIADGGGLLVETRVLTAADRDNIRLVARRVALVGV